MVHNNVTNGIVGACVETKVYISNSREYSWGYPVLSFEERVINDNKVLHVIVSRETLQQMITDNIEMLNVVHARKDYGSRKIVLELYPTASLVVTCSLNAIPDMYCGTCGEQHYSDQMVVPEAAKVFNKHSLCQECFDKLFDERETENKVTS